MPENTSRTPALATSPLPWKTIALLALVYLATAQGRIGNADSASMLLVSRSLIEGHVLVPQGPMTFELPSGKWYSPYGVLVPILWIPLVLAGRLLSKLHLPLSVENCEELVVSFYAPCAMVFAMVLLARTWAEMGCSRARVRAGLWLFGLTTMLWPFAKLPGSDVTVGILLLLAYREHRKGAGATPWFRAGLWLGLGMAARKQTFSIAPVIACVWIAGEWIGASAPNRFSKAFRAACWIGAGALPGVLMHELYTWGRFDSLREPVYPGLENAGIPGPGLWWSQFLQLTVGSVAGVFWYAGLVLATLVLAYRPSRVRGAGSDYALPAGLLLYQILFLAFLPLWAGGVAFGPRLLLPVILLACTAWGWLPEPFTATQRSIIAGAAALGIAINVPGVLTDPLPVAVRNEMTPGRNAIVSRYRESAIVLGLARRTERFSQSGNLTHPPFQIPDFWWCQAIRLLSHPANGHDRATPRQTPGEKP
jgi:hypothetical protein